MSYSVFIRCNATGEVRESKQELDWGESTEFWWTDGNMGCDCNRELEFVRAGGPGPSHDPHWNDLQTECGDSRYSALYAILPDGTRVQLDSPADQPT